MAKVDFAKFVDEMNQQAPFDIMARGLGLALEAKDEKSNTPDKEAIRQMRKKFQERIADSLGKENSQLVELLLGDIEHLLPRVDSDTGLSMLDMVTTGLVEPSAIDRFFKNHGIDWEKDSDYLKSVFIEACKLFNEDISTNNKNRLHKDLDVPQRINPEKLREKIYDIFRCASGKTSQKSLIPQACALLRIAAAIDYVNRDPRIKLLLAAQKKLDRIQEKHFRKYRDRNISYWTFHSGSTGEVPIRFDRFESRLKKRARLMAKVLQKPKNRVEDALDHIGGRITAYSKKEVMLIIYSLFFHPSKAVFPSVSINIAQSKNRLLTKELILEALADAAKADELFANLSQETIDHEELDSSDPYDNEHSSKKYHAIHITFDLPVDTPDGEKACFPVEFQFTDLGSRIINDQEASHESYVERQMAAVRARVLGNNLLTAFKESRD